MFSSIYVTNCLFFIDNNNFFRRGHIHFFLQMKLKVIWGKNLLDCIHYTQGVFDKHHNTTKLIHYKEMQGSSIKDYSNVVFNLVSVLLHKGTLPLHLITPFTTQSSWVCMSSWHTLSFLKLHSYFTAHITTDENFDNKISIHIIHM